jgi:O-antigen ligase
MPIAARINTCTGNAMQGLMRPGTRDNCTLGVASPANKNGGHEYSRRLSILWAWLVCPTVFLLSYVPLLNLYARGVLMLFLMWFIYTTLFVRKRIRFAPPILAFLAWVVFALFIGVFLADDMESAIYKWITILTTGLISLAVINAVIWSGSIHPWSWAFVVSALLAYASSYLPIGGYIVSEYETEVAGRVVGTLANANTFGRAMTQAFLIGLGLLLTYRSQGWRASLVLLAMGVLVSGVIESNSRTAMLGLFAALMAVFHSIGWRYFISLQRLTIFFGMIGAVLSVFFAFPERFTTAMDRMMILTAYIGMTQQVETRERSVEERADLANSALDVFSNHPLGIGLDNFHLIAGTYAHSNYLEVLVSTGFAGLLLYYSGLLWMGWSVFHKAGRAKDPAVARFTLWALLSIAILDISNVSYYSKIYWVFLGLVCGIYVLAAKNPSMVTRR